MNLKRVKYLLKHLIMKLFKKKLKNFNKLRMLYKRIYNPITLKVFIYDKK